MPGFLIGNGHSQISLPEVCPLNVLTDTYRYSNKQNEIFALKSTLNKFLDDKCFAETATLFIVLEGYLLNKKILFAEYDVQNIKDLVERMYTGIGENFFSRFRGCFSGALYDKKENKWVVFTNQIGNAPVFYLKNNGNFVAGSQVTYILEWCKEKKIQLSFNESCAYQLLSYGFVASDETYAHEIKRLHGGDYLVLKDKVLTIKTYHRFERNTARLDSMSEAQIIDEIDKTFRNAVNLEWAKDDEYGYRHLADLSGGLDSRMNLWIAHEEKKRKVTIITYCRIGYLDEIIAKQISLFWQDEFIFKSLDDASFMYDIDENTALLGGLSLYSAITGGKRLLESLNLSEYGIEHTGLVGDIALGSFYRNPRDGEKRRPTGMYSERLKENLPNYIKELYANYSDYEIFLMYTNGFHGACNSQLIRRHYTEVGSPFLNVEFMQLCFDIPINLRIRHNIYKKWIITKYPEAAKFKWEKTCGLITESNSRRYFRRYTKAVIRRIRKAFFKESCRADGMNPIGFWISHNDDLRNFLDSYEKNGYLYLPSTASDQLITDMKELYKTGNASEKAMVLTVLSAARLYW